jgi:phage terminase large subunit-like protein
MTSAAISIDEALTDPELFEPWFSGETWDGWRAVLKAAYALPMTGDEVEFFRSVAERDPPKRRVRELWCVVGRRGGKDSVASVIAAHSAALFSEGHRLRPGERALVMCLAVDRDQAKVVLNYTRSFFTDIDLLKGMVQRETATGFELTNSVDVTISTNSFRSVRGRPILCAILDETAFWRDETSATPDEETYKALRPALASISGSIIIGISSPYGSPACSTRSSKSITAATATCW